MLIRTWEPRTSILRVPSNMLLVRKYDLATREPDHDYTDVPPNLCQLSAYEEAVVTYIAGYVV